MLEMYLSWFEYSKEALAQTVHNLDDWSRISRLIVVGMGGSGIVGDYLAKLSEGYDSSIEVTTFKDFYIPKKWFRNDSAALVISYSGNTLETIAAYRMVRELGLKVAVVTSNGKLLDYAQNDGVPYIEVRKGLVPRAALPCLLIGALKLLHSLGVDVVPFHDVESSIVVLQQAEKMYEECIYIASFLKDSKLPLIIASRRYEPIAIRFKNELNENSKIPAKVEIVPELFHNDIVGWEQRAFVDKALIIPSHYGYENELLKLYVDTLSQLGFDIREVPVYGTKLLERYLSLSLVAGLVSVRLANIRNIDPLETKSIKRYKETLVRLYEVIERELGLKK